MTLSPTTLKEKNIMPDPRKLRSDKYKYSTRIDIYLKYVDTNSLPENFIETTQLIDKIHNDKRIWHEVQRRKDYNVFHEIFKLNKDEINAMVVPFEKEPEIKRNDFLNYLKQMKKYKKHL